MRVCLLWPLLSFHLHTTVYSASSASKGSSKKVPVHCRLVIPVSGTSPDSASLDEDPESAIASFSSDFAFADKAAPLRFVSYAISGAAGVYVNSVGLTAEEGATDALGRSITAETRRLLSPDEWAKVLRAANLQLSVALAQLNSPKALLVVNLSEDAEPLSVAFSRERRLNTFLSVLAWSRVQAVSHELRFFLSRVEALVLVDVPNPVAESLPLLISMLYHAALFAEGAGDTAAVLQDAKLLSALSASCSPLGFPPEPDKDNAECLRLSKAATERLEVYSQHLDGQRAPRLHVSPVGDAYYLKRFISPPDMPSQYLPHSVRTLEESKEQRDVVRFLTDCLPIAFGSQRLRYAKPSQQPDAAAGLLAAAVASMHARIIPDL